MKIAKKQQQQIQASRHTFNDQNAYALFSGSFHIPGIKIEIILIFLSLTQMHNLI